MRHRLWQGHIVNVQISKYGLIATGLLSAAAVGVMIGNLSGPRIDTQNAQLNPIPRSEPIATATVTSVPPSPTARPVATTEATTVTPTVLIVIEPTRTVPTAVPVLVDYTVQPGDILFTLAQRFNTTPELIVALNPGINPESLTVGEVLRLPAPTAQR
jgi:LysM repeat protein